MSGDLSSGNSSPHFGRAWNNPEETAKVECGDFYNSGDRATVDEDGYFWFLGRNDDVINASGYRIGPAEVENALAEHPAVTESAVVSSPDPNRGQVMRTQKPLSYARAGETEVGKLSRP
ncbi:hypothetical protein STEG23_024778 [Scotinomys teguina]